MSYWFYLTKHETMPIRNLIRYVMALFIPFFLNLHCNAKTQYGALIAQVFQINNQSLHICLFGISYAVGGGMLIIID